MVDERRSSKGKREKRRQRDLKIEKMGRRGNIDEYTRI